MSVDHQERVEKGLFESVTVIDENGDEVTVYNWLTVKTEARVRGHNPVFEQFEDAVKIGAGDSWMEPEAVTEMVALELEDQRGIDVREHGIRVIDTSSEEVTVV